MLVTSESFDRNAMKNKKKRKFDDEFRAGGFVLCSVGPGGVVRFLFNKAEGDGGKSEVNDALAHSGRTRILFCSKQQRYNQRRGRLHSAAGLLVAFAEKKHRRRWTMVKQGRQRREPERAGHG